MEITKRNMALAIVVVAVIIPGLFLACGTSGNQSQVNVSQLEENKELVQRLYGTLMAEGDVDSAREILGENFVDHDIPGAGQGGREELIQAVMSVRSAFPDVKPELFELVAQDEWVAVRVEAGGHHTGGPFLGIPASGKPIQWKEIHLFRVANGKIAEHRGVFDLLSILQQLGAIPAPEAPQS
jgi:steroid delta-isomerase-like uncharacterized protein